MKITAEPRSDQWNADDFIGGGRTFTIAGVKVGKAEQKYDIDLVEGEGRAWRPPLTVLRLLIAAWGDEAATWVGRRVTLYRDPSIKYGGDQVGGIRVSHMTNLPDGKTFTVKLTSARGRKEPHTVEPLTDTTRPAPLPVEQRIEMALASFASIGVSVERLEFKLDTPRAEWGTPQLAFLGTWYNAITKDGIDADSLLPSDSRPDALGGAGVKANLRRGQLTAIEEDFARLLGAPVDPEEMLWWAGLIVSHPVESLAELETDDLRKLQSRLNRLRDRDQLEAELGLKGGE